LKIEIEASLLKSLRALSKEERVACMESIFDTTTHFGNPHLHAGIGIRKLAKDTYECRAGLHLRIIFLRYGNTLIFRMVGNHNDVVKYLKNK